MGVKLRAGTDALDLLIKSSYTQRILVRIYSFF